MNFRIHPLLVFLGSLVGLTACDADFFSKEIDSGSISEPLPAIQCEIDGRSQNISLTLAEAIPKYGFWTDQNLFERIRFISDATVQFSEEDEWVQEVPINTDIDSFIYNFKGAIQEPLQAGKRYTLEATTASYGQIWATETMPEAPELLAVRWLEGTRSEVDTEQEFKVLQIDVQNKGEAFFVLNFGAYDSDSGERVFTLSNLQAPVLKEGSFAFNEEYFVSELAISDISTIEVEFPLFALQNASNFGSLEVFLASCTEDHFSIKKAIRDQAFLNDGFFSEPVIVRTNLNQGMGHFTLIHSMEPFVIEIPEL